MCNIIFTHNVVTICIIVLALLTIFESLIILTRKTVVFVPTYILLAYILLLFFSFNSSSQLVVKLTFLLSYTNIRSVV